MEKLENQGDWAQRYRPQRLEDVILPSAIKQRLITMRDSGEGPSLLLHGRAGTGKTTVASLLNPENTHKINCSLKNGIKDVRRLEGLSAVALWGGTRLVLLDEADSLTHESQTALRGLLEDLSGCNRFVLTANYPANFIEPIRSRVVEIDFGAMAGNQAMKLEMLDRVHQVLINEGVTDFDINIVRAIVDKRFPDMRRILKDLQYQFMEI